MKTDIESFAVSEVPVNAFMKKRRLILLLGAFFKHIDWELFSSEKNTIAKQRAISISIVMQIKICR